MLRDCQLCRSGWSNAIQMLGSLGLPMALYILQPASMVIYSRWCHSSPGASRDDAYNVAGRNTLRTWCLILPVVALVQNILVTSLIAFRIWRVDIAAQNLNHGSLLPICALLWSLEPYKSPHSYCTWWHLRWTLGLRAVVMLGLCSTYCSLPCSIFTHDRKVGVTTGDHQL